MTKDTNDKHKDGLGRLFYGMYEEGAACILTFNHISQCCNQQGQSCLFLLQSLKIQRLLGPFSAKAQLVTQRAKFAFFYAEEVSFGLH